MKIGNIVSKEPLKVDDVYNLVTSIDECISGLPTLLVGLDYVREYDLDYMDRKLTDGRYWTFTRKESRKHHVIDLDSFKDFCFKTIIEKMDYIFVDPIQFTLSKMKKVLHKINTLDNPVTYNHEGVMLYIFSENLIFGVNLNLCNYIGISVDKVINKIKVKSSVFLDHEDVLIEYKEYMERLNNEVKYIPILYSIRHGNKNNIISNVY